MKNLNNLIRVALAASVLALTVSACGTSRLSGITDDGLASQLVWPEIKKGGWMQEGTFVNLLSLQSINTGMTKNQLYDTLGAPHFNEGVFGVREWDYIFNLRTGGPKGEYVTCQYKVIFDRDYVAQSYHWREAKCAELASQTDVKPTRKVNISADALFQFGESSEAHLVDAGKREVAALATELKDAKDVAITVIGHTDEIGTDASNIALSQARANTVRQLLIDGGLNSATIRAIGAGESQPVKQCDSTQSREEYIACLQPNRRVEIEILGVK